MLLATVNRAHEGWLQFARGGRRVPVDVVDEEGMLDLNQIRAAFRAGETLYLTKAHRLSPSLMHLSRAIELDFVANGVALRAPVSAHVFLTPPRSQAFPAHRDEHASFVLQIDGSKEWTVFEDVRPLVEVRRSGGVDRDSLTSARSRTYQLNTGDVLYIPEWWVHEARTSDCHSLHVTLRVFPLRWGDLLRELCAETPALADPIPRHLTESPRELTESLVRVLESAEFRDPLAASVSKVARRHVVPANALPDDGFGQLLEMNCIGQGTWLTRSAGVSCHVFKEDTDVCIKFPGGVIRGPAVLREAFEYVASAERFRVCDLPALGGRDYNRLDVARRMVQDGLLRIVYKK